MEHVGCDLCGAEESVLVASQTDRLHGTTTAFFSVVRCTACGLHYLNPRPDVSEIGRHYADGYSFHGVASPLRRAAARALAWLANSPLAAPFGMLPFLGRRLAAHLKPALADPVRVHLARGGPGPFLDIGCGSGAHAHFWGERGSLQAYRALTDVAGLETAAGARQALASTGITAYAALDEVPPQARFGVIRMNWSLEHVHAPSAYFDFIAQRLAAGGRAVIAVPNYDGMLYRLAPDCVEVPVHLYHFRPADIAAYAARHGLRVIETVTFSYPQMFVAAAAAGLLPPSFSRFENFSNARALARALSAIDAAGMGNDMVVILERAQH